MKVLRPGSVGLTSKFKRKLTKKKKKDYYYWDKFKIYLKFWGKGCLLFTSIGETC